MTDDDSRLADEVFHQSASGMEVDPPEDRLRRLLSALVFVPHHGDVDSAHYDSIIAAITSRLDLDPAALSAFLAAGLLDTLEVFGIQSETIQFFFYYHF